MGDIIKLPDGWDIFCIGRDYQNNYWLEVRHIGSGKLAREMGLEIYHAKTIREVVYAAADAIEALTPPTARDKNDAL